MESQNLVPINNVAEKLGVSIQAVGGYAEELYQQVLTSKLGTRIGLI